MLVGLGASGDYVTTYPYACAEQMASRALVLVLGTALGPSFTFTAGPAGSDARRGDAQAALDRLEGYHCDGGYSYWRGDCGLRSPYLSAYLLYVRAIAKRHGFTVDPASLVRDAAELDAALARPPAAPSALDDTAWRAFAAKVLADAGRRPTASLDRLYAARETLPVFALAHLLDATAALDADGPRIAELRRRLRNALTVGATAHVEEKTLAPYAWCSTCCPGEAACRPRRRARSSAGCSARGTTAASGTAPRTTSGAWWAWSRISGLSSRAAGR
jgi:nicotinamide mononucleotide (NMN) deamidase PncC